MIRKIVILGALMVAGQLTKGLSQVNFTQNPSLQLKAGLVGQYYCHQPGSDQVEVVLKLQLKFINNGDEPLILYRKCDELLRLSRSKTLSDALAHKYESSFF